MARPKIISLPKSRDCIRCHLTAPLEKFRILSSGRPDSYCKLCRVAITAAWRKKNRACSAAGQRTAPVSRNSVRQNLLDQFGGKCSNCGYNKCNAALHFHHVDPSEKKLWAAAGNKRSLREVGMHPERFVLFCANCHIEYHALLRLSLT